MVDARTMLRLPGQFALRCHLKLRQAIPAGYSRRHNPLIVSIACTPALSIINNMIWPVFG